MIARVIVFSLLLSVFWGKVFSQIRVTFTTVDGLQVVADHYPVNKTFPYILLFHQMESSRGEYREIAPRLNKLGYNCLAIDLRAGKEINFVQNETALNALSGRYSRSLIDSRKDMEAAIEFVKMRTELPAILFGSSFSASLALMIAKERDDVSGVVALSPGEYFEGNLVRNYLQGLEKPVWIAAVGAERRFVSELTGVIAGTSRQLFLSENEKNRGAKILWENEPGSNEAWLSLMVFLKNLKNTQVDIEN